MYTYPPCRLQIPLLILTLFAYSLKDQRLNKKSITVFILTFISLSLPLAYGILSGDLQQRFNEISIFNNNYLISIGKKKDLIDLSSLFINNFFSHFNLNYLLRTGDLVGGHTLNKFGIVSWIDTAGFICLIYFLIIKSKKIFQDYYLLLFVFSNFLIGIIPSALTYIDIPSALRSIGSLPFLSLLMGYGLFQLSQKWRFGLLAISIVTIIFSCVYLKSYFKDYATDNKGWFNFWIKDAAAQIKNEDDWLRFMVYTVPYDYHFCYYLMNYHQENCLSSREKWYKLKEIIDAHQKH